MVVRNGWKNIKIKVWAGILLAQILLFFALSKCKVAITAFENLFEIKKIFHQKIFAQFAFSVGDLLYFSVSAMLFYFIAETFNKKKRKSSLSQILILINFIYFFYQIFWGMLYFQEPIIKKLSKDTPNLLETKALALKYLELCQKDRKLVREDRNGVFKIYNLREIQQEILKEQRYIPTIISDKKPSPTNSFKPSIFSTAMSYTGILGYYNPFTAEAQFNPNVPSSSLPFTLAHESAHQLGFAREEEANFIGFLIGKDSHNKDLKYSSDLFALKSILDALAEKNQPFVKEILHNYSKEMKRDRLYEKAYIKQHRGLLDDFFGITNNIFLKSNGQDGSITYSYFTDLLIRYERK